MRRVAATFIPLLICVSRALRDYRETAAVHLVTVNSRLAVAVRSSFADATNTWKHQMHAASLTANTHAYASMENPNASTHSPLHTDGSAPAELCDNPSTSHTEYTPDTYTSYSTLPFNRLHFKTIDSTQKWCSRNFNALRQTYNLSASTWLEVSAAVQTQGIGRRSSHNEKSWSSPLGSLYVSYVIPWQLSKRYLLINAAQTAALAVANTAEEFGVYASIKWVNDVMVNERKLAGTISQSTGNVWVENEEEYTDVLIGIGVNVDPPASSLSEISQPTTSLCLEVNRRCPENCGESQKALSTKRLLMDSLDVLGRAVPVKLCVPTVDRVLHILTRNIHEAISILLEHGFSNHWSQVDRRLIWKGERVKVVDDEMVVEGVLKGIRCDGRLVLTCEDGEKEFMTGSLLRVK